MDIVSKICNKCNIEKPISEFHKQKSMLDGYRGICKECRKQESLNYYWSDPEKSRRANRDKLKKDPEKWRAYEKAQREKWNKTPQRIFHPNLEKACTSCNVIKPLTEYHKRDETPDKLHYFCKACVKAKSTPRESPESKKCARCKETKSRESFNNHHRRDGLSVYCIQCLKEMREPLREQRKEYSKNYYRKNKVVFLQKCKEWIQRNLGKRRDIARRYSHMRRAWEKGGDGSYTQEQWETLCDFYGRKCLKCGKSEPEIKLTPDHIVPLSRHGDNTIDNIQPLCLICNISKNAKTIDYRPEYNYVQGESDNTEGTCS